MVVMGKAAKGRKSQATCQATGNIVIGRWHLWVIDIVNNVNK